jgi:hypothetical protein
LGKRIDLTTDTGSHLERLLKVDVIDFQCRLQDTACLKYANERFSSIPDEYFTSQNQTNP